MWRHMRSTILCCAIVLDSWISLLSMDALPLLTQSGTDCGPATVTAILVYAARQHTAVDMGACYHIRRRPVCILSWLCTARAVGRMSAGCSNSPCRLSALKGV